MKRTIISCLMASFLPGAAFASHTEIGVHVNLAGGPGWGGEETWVEFEPEYDSFVAVYATFSDGSFGLVYPVDAGDDHWVWGGEVYEVPVLAPYGTRIVDVQAVASADWFDPSECWLAHDRGNNWRSRVYVAAAYPVWTWGFAFTWSSHAHCWTPARHVNWYAPHCEPVYRIDRARFRSWDRWRDYHGDRRWDRQVDIARSPSGSKDRHVVKGESRRPVRKEASDRSPTRREASVDRDTWDRDDRARSPRADVRKQQVERGRGSRPERREVAQRDSRSDRKQEVQRGRDSRPERREVAQRGRESRSDRKQEVQRGRDSRPERRQQVERGRDSRSQRQEVRKGRESRPQERRQQVQSGRGPRPQERKQDVVKSQGPKRENGSNGGSVRSNGRGGSKSRVDSAPGRKSSPSRRNSGEPKRGSGR